MSEADPNAPYRSEYVCDRLARKTIEGMGDAIAKANAARFNEQLLLPVAKRLIMSQKMRQGELGRMATHLARTLRSDKGVVEVELDSFAKKLSTNEEHRLAYILAVSDQENWLDFVVSEARMQRRRLTTSVCVSDVRIHRHALSRYMQRELRPAERMFDDMAETLHLSSMLGVAAASTDYDCIAIPLKDGLLLGRIGLIADQGTRMTLVMDKDGPRPSETLRASIAEDARVGVQLMSYVSGDALGPVKERLRDAIVEYGKRHRVGVKALFDAAYYTCSPLRGQSEAAYMEDIEGAINGASALVNSTEWQAWAANRSY